MSVGTLRIENARIFVPDRPIERGTVVVRDGKIAGIWEDGSTDSGLERGESFELIDTIDAEGLDLIPGMIDVHVHGGAGNDVMSDNEGELEALSVFEARHGVTAFLATTYTVEREKLVRTLPRIAEAARRGMPGAVLVGIHLEGPFLNPVRRGSQSAEFIRPGTVEELDAYMALSDDRIRLLTIAPEFAENREVVRQAVRRGITVSVGHSDATWEQMAEAVRDGASHVTHLFNGMRPLHHREPGTVGAALAMDELAVELICDGIHVHPELVRYVFRTKRSDKIVAITDAQIPAGCPDGRYLLGGSVEVEVNEGCILLTNGGGLAGSCLTMDKALRNVMAYTGCELHDILPAFTINPASQIGLAGRKGSIEIGKDADLVLLKADGGVAATFIGGACVYRSSGQ